MTGRDKVVFIDASGARKTFRKQRYAIVVKTRRGADSRSARTFASNSPGEWFRVLPRSARQSRREDLRNGPTTEPLGDGTVHLAEGFEPRASHLTVILDALRSGDRHDVDLADIRLVVTDNSLGRRISSLSTLTAEQRRLAQPALYAEILRRCTIIHLST